MHTSLPVHSNVTSTPSSSSSQARAGGGLVRARRSAASDFAVSSWPVKENMLAGVITPESGVDVPELRLLLLYIDELHDDVWSGRGTTYPWVANPFSRA